MVTVVKSVFVIASALLVSGLLVARPLRADFSDGQEAYDRGDYEKALKEWCPLGTAGDADAQNNIGWMYFTGEGVPQDRGLARQWFRFAAERGHAGAQVNLGRMYADGWAGSVDFAEAERWYRRAAEQGHPMGQFNLGFNLAFEWDQLGAPPSGVRTDHIEAYKWLSLAEPYLSGNQKELAVRLLDLIDTVLSPEQTAKAERLKQEWDPVDEEWRSNPVPEGFDASELVCVPDLSDDVYRILTTRECTACDLNSADPGEAYLVDAKLSGSNLSGANLRDAHLNGADLSNTNLRGAGLDGAKLFRANFSNADLTGASLVGANLEFAQLRGASLTDADLTDAKLETAHTRGAVFCNTRMPDGTVNNTNCP